MEYLKSKGESQLIISRKLFNINARGGTLKWSPLHLAILEGNYELVEILASTDYIDLYIENKNQKTLKAII